jgi:predicted transcriptional regulator
MKDSEIKELDEDDHVFIETLKTLGMSRNVATTIAYLMKVNEASAQEIKLSTGLRQPEISFAMKVMCNQSWASMRLEKNTGKGRPTNIYSLAVPVGEIISYYEDKITKESEATISVIKKLKAISKRMPHTHSN